jgi:hypothetical protein
MVVHPSVIVLAKNAPSIRGKILSINRVGVEKLHFRQNSENLGDRKCIRKPRKSFVGRPSAKFFQPFSDERVFQHPLAIALTDSGQKNRSGRTASCVLPIKIKIGGQQCPAHIYCFHNRSQL